MPISVIELINYRLIQSLAFHARKHLKFQVTMF